MHEEAMNRSEFLKHVFKRTVDTAAQAVGNHLRPLHSTGDEAEAVRAVPLIHVEDYRNEPKLITTSNPPLYIIGEAGVNLTAVPAQCPNDDFLLFYLPREDALYCGACGAKHALAYDAERVTTDLPQYSLTVAEGFIRLMR